MSTIKSYLGDGVYLEIEGTDLRISGSRLGERPITLRPAVFKRFIQEGIKYHNKMDPASISLLKRLVERALPEEELEAPPVNVRTIPLLAVSRTRDEEMAEWEATLRRKRDALAKPRPDAEARPLKPIQELA